MHPMAEVVWDLFGEDASEHGLPPGFRFHPTDEELVTFYLASKVFNGGRCGLDIVEVDLNRCEPWELPDSAEAAKMGEREWYFFSLRDRKYPTGLRTNRATSAGYWKATGKDREVHSAATSGLVGMKKTLVFYKGRAPRGEKTKWVLHEYRFEGDFSCRHACKEEWVICRIFNKAGGDKRSPYYFPSPTYFLDHPSSSSAAPSLPPFLDLQVLQSPTQTLLQTNHPYLHQEPNPLLFPLPFPPPGPTTSLHPLLKTQCPPNLQTPISDPAPPEEALISNWLDSYLRNPLVCDMGLGPLGLLPLGSGAAHDMALFGSTATGDCGPLVP